MDHIISFFVRDLSRPRDLDKPTIDICLYILVSTAAYRHMCVYFMRRF